MNKPSKKGIGYLLNPSINLNSRDISSSVLNGISVIYRKMQQFITLTVWLKVELTNITLIEDKISMELSIKNLSKTYSNGVVALDNVSLNISTGLFGLLGPNGAGKSTLMRIIATLQEADSGEILFEDIDVLKQKSEVKKVLGYLPQDFGFYQD